jgi:hypothetical protein
MALAIWKYPLRVDDEQQVDMPIGAKVLSVGVQHGTLCVWALVDPTSKETTPRTFWIFGTGHAFPKTWSTGNMAAFVGTVMMSNGFLVWHVFTENY